MLLSHYTVFTHNISRLRDWYSHYFGMRASAVDAHDDYCTCRLVSDDGRFGVLLSSDTRISDWVGTASLAFSVRSAGDVCALTDSMRRAGHTVAVEPDANVFNIFRSVVLDPDGNRVSVVE